MSTDDLNELHGDVNPGHPTRGLPARVWLAEVVTVNPNGTVDCRPIYGRATKIGVQVPAGYKPVNGDQVLVTDISGDPRQPIVIHPVQRTLPTVTGAKAGNTPLVLSLLAALNQLGWINDQTT